MTRAEQSSDREKITKVNDDAFGGTDESRLVNLLRVQAEPHLSLIAEDDGLLCGHIMFSPATVVKDASLKVFGLAPMSVTPAKQNAGIGSLLVKEGLSKCKALGYGGVIVLGHPTYYPRFGFKPGIEFELACEYDVPSEVFMALELIEGYFKNVSGTVKYHAAFGAL